MTGNDVSIHINVSAAYSDDPSLEEIQNSACRRLSQISTQSAAAKRRSKAQPSNVVRRASASPHPEHRASLIPPSEPSEGSVHNDFRRRSSTAIRRSFVSTVQEIEELLLQDKQTSASHAGGGCGTTSATLSVADTTAAASSLHSSHCLSPNVAIHGKGTLLDQRWIANAAASLRHEIKQLHAQLQEREVTQDVMTGQAKGDDSIELLNDEIDGLRDAIQREEQRQESLLGDQRALQEFIENMKTTVRGERFARNSVQNLLFEQSALLDRLRRRAARRAGSTTEESQSLLREAIIAASSADASFDWCKWLHKRDDDMDEEEALDLVKHLAAMVKEQLEVNIPDHVAALSEEEETLAKGIAEARNRAAELLEADEIISMRIHAIQNALQFV